MANSNSFHSEALTKLCRFCGCFLSGKYFEVSRYSEDLVTFFYLREETLNADEEIYPSNFCFKCYGRMKNFAKRKSTPSTPLKVWAQHNDACDTCSLYKSLKMGVVGKNKFKNVVLIRNKGRPCKNWTREDSDALSNSVSDNFISPISLDLIKEENPHWRLCTCKICEGLIKTPMKISKCEDVFCLDCLLRSLEGAYGKLCCPKCKIEIEKTDISFSLNSLYLIKTLKLKCQKLCGETFTVERHNEKIMHESSCTGTKTFTLTDVLSIDKQAEVPKTMEKVALHVIRHKIANSEGRNVIKFPSGGSQVRIFTHFINFVQKVM